MSIFSFTWATDVMASLPKFCVNEECNYADDGKCVEGYSLDECPHLKSFAVENIDVIEVAEPVPSIERTHTLSSGEALDRAQASMLQRRRLSRAIGLIGPNNAGKTSLIASVYDLLQDGPIAGIGFAGSATLIGFEKVCHDSRAASRRGTPHTERTTVGAEATFFHLDLRTDEGELVSLFMGDRSGEDYLSASDEVVRSAEFFELRRADTVTLLVNGEHLVGSEQRHQVKAVSPQIIGALVEGGGIRYGARLAIVLTKNDAVRASAKAERVKREFDEIVTEIAEQHREHVHEVRSFVVAASPAETSDVPRGDGVGELLRYWLGASPRSEQSSNPAIGPATRAIDLFGREGGPQT